MQLGKCRKKANIKQTGTLNKNAEVNPNIIWQTKRRIKGQNKLEYDLITEEGSKIINPEEPKEYITTYFENLFQARPGTEENQKWTEEITNKVENITKEHHFLFSEIFNLLSGYKY